MKYDVILFRGESIFEVVDSVDHLVRLNEVTQEELGALTRIMERQSGVFLFCLPWEEGDDAESDYS